jgi:hypothetical protein
MSECGGNCEESKYIKVMDDFDLKHEVSSCKTFDEIKSEVALLWCKNAIKNGHLRDVNVKNKPHYKWSWKNNRAERVI